jgi:hypothetical protein
MNASRKTVPKRHRESPIPIENLTIHDHAHYDAYEKERTTVMDTRETSPIQKNDIIHASQWNNTSTSNPNFPKLSIMSQYIHNMIQTAMCLLKSKTKEYKIKFLDFCDNGCLYNLSYNNSKRTVRFQLYTPNFPLEQKTWVRCNNFPNDEIAVKMHGYCYVWFPKEEFYVAIIEMDHIDGMLSDLLASLHEDEDDDEVRELDDHNNPIDDPSEEIKDAAEGIGKQVLYLLDVMTHKGLTYCRMFPGNLGYQKTEQGNYKILLVDFSEASFSKTYTYLNVLSLVLGSISYMGASPGEKCFQQFILEEAQLPHHQPLISSKDLEHIMDKNIISPKKLKKHFEIQVTQYLTSRQDTLKKTIRRIVRTTNPTKYGQGGPNHHSLKTRNKYSRSTTPDSPPEIRRMYGEVSPVPSHSDSTPTPVASGGILKRSTY